MKKLLYVMASLALLFTACTRELETRLSDVETRLAKVEEQVKELNSQVTLIRQLINGKYFIQSAAELPDGSGYKLVLVDKDGNSLEKTVLNGKDGADGEDGVSPTVGVKKDTDGNYYWTLNGEWLLVGGEKVRANGVDGTDGKDGKDAPATQFKVENGKWYVKVGDGAWTYVGEAATLIQGPIASIDASGADVVVITLTDNTVLELPKAAVAVKLQILVDDSVFQNMTAGQTQSAPYEVKAPAGVTYTLDSYEPENWKVTLSEPKDNKGIVTISIPAAGKSAKVLLIASGSDGSSYAKVLHIEVEGSEEEGPVVLQEMVDATAGSIDLPAGATDVAFTATWIILSGNQLLIATNDTYDARIATVSFKVGEKSYVLTVMQAQKDAIVLTENTLQVVAEGEEIPFVIQANVTVEAVADVDWITVTPATKGLEDKPFTVKVAANETSAPREGTITFSSGELQQVVTVTQAAGEPVLPPVGGVFELLTDASILQEGDELLLVNQAKDFAMGAQNGTYRSRTAITVVDNAVADPGEGVAVITLEGEEGAWNLKVSDGYLAAQSGANNQLLTMDAVTEYATWTISIADNGIATVKAAAGARNLLLYNSQATRFSCYANTSPSTKEVLIFHKAGTPATPVTQYDALGLYLGKQERVYQAGIDQYVRSYDGSALQFVLMEPQGKEQVKLSGFTTALQPGDAVTVSVDWKKDKTQVLEKAYPMTVLKDQDGKLWIGDAKGRGVIIRK